MNFVVALYAAILFFVLSPNVLLRLPPKGSIKVVAAVHAVVFGLVLFFTGELVWHMSMGMMPMKKEGFKEGASCTKQCNTSSPYYPTCVDNGGTMKCCTDSTGKSCLV
jgi:hypothetical protein